MQPFRAASAGVMSLVLALALQGCSAQEPAPDRMTPPDRAADEAAIRAIVAGQQSAINARDFAAFSEYFTPDGDFIVGPSPRATGADAIRQVMETGWATAPAERQITISLDNIRFLGDDVALVDVSAAFSVGEPAQDRATSVATRSNGEWRLAALRVYQGMSSMAP